MKIPKMGQCTKIPFLVIDGSDKLQGLITLDYILARFTESNLNSKICSISKSLHPDIFYAACSSAIYSYLDKMSVDLAAIIPMVSVDVTRVSMRILC